jgi:hypothetical protein
VQSKGGCPLSKVVFIGSPSLLGFSTLFSYMPHVIFTFFFHDTWWVFEGTIQASWGKKKKKKDIIPSILMPCNALKLRHSSGPQGQTRNNRPSGLRGLLFQECPNARVLPYIRVWAGRLCQLLDSVTRHNLPVMITHL